jgi:hypothetical protein
MPFRQPPQEGVPSVRCNLCEKYLLCGRPGRTQHGEEYGLCTMEAHLPWCTPQFRYTGRVARVILKAY